MNAGIDYGLGTSNIDPDTGIRFGVINGNQLDSYSMEDIISNGEDRDFEDFKDAVKQDLESAVERVLETYGLDRCNESDAISDDILDALQFDDYESNGDCTRYLYECDGYKIQTCSDGDWFILKSKFYTRAQFCSPCAPGAGFLMNPCESGPKTYCLNTDWFDSDRPCPYPIWTVDGDELVYQPKSED